MRGRLVLGAVLAGLIALPLALSPYRVLLMLPFIGDAMAGYMARIAARIVAGG